MPPSFSRALNTSRAIAAILILVPNGGVMLRPAAGVQQTPVSEVLRAAAAEKAGHYEEAIAHYESVLKNVSDSAPEMSTIVAIRTKLATDQFLLHRYEDALRVLEPVFLAGKQSSAGRIPAQAWLVKGLAELELNRVSDAVTSLGRALAGNPESGTARLALGDAHARAGQFEKASREYREQLRRTPDLPDAWFKLGTVYSQFAGQIVDDWARTFPDDASVRRLRTEALLREGDYLGTARALFPVVTAGVGRPPPPDTHADLGMALLGMGYFKAAEEQFRRELRENPESPGARLGLAEVKAFDGDWAQAVAFLDELVRDQPRALGEWLESSPPPPLRDAWTAGRISPPAQFEGASVIRIWRQWLAGESIGPLASREDEPCPPSGALPIRPPGIWAKEPCYRRIAGELGTTKVLSEQARAKLAESEFRLGRYDEANQDAMSLLAAHPQNPWGRYWLAKSYQALAERAWSKTAALNPNSARVHQMLAQVYAKRYKLAQAESEYQTALRLEPHRPDLHLGLGTLYWQAGNWSRAERELLRTVELTPGSAVASYELGDTYINLRQWEKSIPYLGIALGEPAVAYRARLDLAKAEAERGRTREAVENLSAVAEQDKDGELHYRLASLYHKLGDSSKAAEALAESQRLRATAFQLDREKMRQLEEDREFFQKLERTIKN